MSLLLGWPWSINPHCLKYKIYSFSYFVAWIPLEVLKR
jgi:hypothetical protein